MGHQHHISRRKGYNRLVSAIKQRMRRRKKISFGDFTSQKLPLLVSALIETGLSQDITVDTLKSYYKYSDEEIERGFRTVLFTFEWNPKENTYSDVIVTYTGRNSGDINGRYYEADSALEKIGGGITHGTNNTLRGDSY